LKVRKQCEEAYSKASQMLGLINRTIQFKNPKVLLPLYKSTVRLHLEYCSAVWCPQYVKDKYLLERVQHRFSGMFSELKSLPYEQQLNKLGLWTLEQRHNRADLLEIFKSIKGLTAVSWSHFCIRVKNRTTRGHNWKIMKKNSSCDLRYDFFSQRSVNCWNNLTQDEVNLPSINSFKNHLEKCKRWKMDFFMD